MEQSEILSLAERLIPAYGSEDFEDVLSQMTDGEAPSVKFLVKMELNKLMAPCTKTLDLRGRVQGECREYQLDGLVHWLDDVAFNVYHKNVRKYGGYTEGVWLALCNTKNNFRVMQQRGKPSGKEIVSDATEFDVEPLQLGYDLKRKENRLKISSQVELTLPGKQLVHGVTSDISPSGARVKVPTAFNYRLGDNVDVLFIEIAQSSEEGLLCAPVQYRIIGIDDSMENDSVKFLRLINTEDSQEIEQVIEISLKNEAERAKHDNQDKIIRARTRGYEHTYLKHSCHLPLFFSKDKLSIVLMTENNKSLWQYWHDERNQQNLTSLFNHQRLQILTQPGMSGSSNVLYSFTHEHQDKTLFFSMMMPEATQAQRLLFWHIGARKESWRAFRVSIFQLTDEEKKDLAQHSDELATNVAGLTHCGYLQEIADTSSAHDYLLTEKPRLPSSELNPFRHTRAAGDEPLCLYFDAKSRRKEPRYQFNSPIEITANDSVYQGQTLDISKHGLLVALKTPYKGPANCLATINLLEMQLYDKNLPMSAISYEIIRVSNNGQRVQLLIEEGKENNKIIHFFNRLIEHNKKKLVAKREALPSDDLLEGLHDTLLRRNICWPLFMEKRGPSIKPRILGVQYPLPDSLIPFAKLGPKDKFSLDPIYKGRSNTLLAQPMKRVEAAVPTYHDVYIGIMKFGSRIQSVETKLFSEFESLKERIGFIKNAQDLGEFYVLRISGVPVFDPWTSLLRKDIQELAPISLHNAKKLEKEIGTLLGYGEVIDITEEVLIRLQLTQ